MAQDQLMTPTITPKMTPLHYNKNMNIRLLNYLLHPLHLILCLLSIKTIHCKFLRILNSYFYTHVELENRCKGCNIHYKPFIFRHLKIKLDVIEDVKDVNFE